MREHELQHGIDGVWDPQWPSTITICEPVCRHPTWQTMSGFIKSIADYQIEAEGQTVQLRIAANGCGFNRSTQRLVKAERMLSLFLQVVATTKRR